jgi:arginyl-tRNA synthetase
MPRHLTPLHKAAADAVATHAGVATADLKVETPPKPELGDLAVGCFAIAKAQKTSPAAAATAIAAAFQPGAYLASATAAGPFVNFRADRAQTFRWLIDAALTGSLVPKTIGAGQTICIDYSSPNISKQLAYHHIRSTVIGHALAQTFRALGYRVIGINHLGDWGTTHGMLLAAWERWGHEIATLDISALNDLYQRFRAAMKDNPALDGVGRQWFKRLESGEPEVRARWEQFRAISLAEFQAVYDLIGIAFDEIRGESAYEPAMPDVMKRLRDAGLVTESEGALVVQLEGEKTPILLETKDGTTLYATRDVAAAEYRWNTYHFTRSLYVVDRGQALHFRQVFKLLAKMGYEWAARCEHVPFGVVRFDGVKGTSREGALLLRDVFADAQAAVQPRITEKNPAMAPELAAKTAQQVGIGAVMFATLVAQREKDVDFTLERATSLEGDSGPYLMYTHARCASIARKAAADFGERVESVDGVDTKLLVHDAEWAVARRLLDLPDVVVRAADACEPHAICHYLLELAGDFSRWYTQGNGDAALRILVDDAPTRRARLALMTAVQCVLRDGLALLGLAAPDQM